MKQLKADNEESYHRQFKRYIDAGLDSAKIEALYKKAHAAIRADPNKKRDPLQLGRFGKRDKPKDPKKTYEHKRYNKIKLTHEQRRANAVERLKEAGATVVKPRAMEE